MQMRKGVKILAELEDEERCKLTTQGGIFAHRDRPPLIVPVEKLCDVAAELAKWRSGDYSNCLRT